MQASLFYDDIYDALRDVVKAMGGPKEVGNLLWPDKDLRASHTAVLNCLDPNRAEKFSPTQLVMLMKLGRQKDCHAAMQYIAGECGYEVKAIEPEDEMAALQRKYIEAVRVLATLTPKIEQAQQKLKSVG